MEMLVLFDSDYKDSGKDVNIYFTRAMSCAIQPNFKQSIEIIPIQTL